MTPVRYQKRISFCKEGKMRFIGHLDMLRTFQRALQRANVELVFSQGFNPHPQMSFSQPLSLGVSGRHEYMELQLATPWEDDDLVHRVNAELPAGLRLIECQDMPEGTKSAMSLSTHAQYHIQLPSEYADAYPALLEQFMAGEPILIRKWAKHHGRKQEVEVDLRPMIRSLRLIAPCMFELWCACSGTQNLKPDRMMQVFWERAGLLDAIGTEQVCRMDLYREEEGRMKTLMDLLTEK